MNPGFERAVESAARALPPAHLRVLAARIAEGWPAEALALALPTVDFAPAARAVLAAKEAGGVSDAEAAAYLRGVAAGMVRQAAEVTVESVWSGPHTHAVPLRSTAQVLVELVGEARRELLLMTYSAKPYAPVLEALAAAIERGVGVVAVVETLRGAGGALTDHEPAAAFRSVPGVELWHWPTAQRTEAGAKMHAKLAVADRRDMLVSSANLTQSGIGKNVEAGVRIRGGAAPRRVAEHLAELRFKGILARL
ncbi:PLD-like domain-containing protein [Sinosporangium album]|uniref:PLD-like domain-containing protein n=1 Tax=Sinosporangium album TaxID=504805 RepID=A0A1G7RCB2_9ACTN|nr:DISARM system phospholipase D-like protein DrmC [Sinosporangium album]SDG08382.1 PLD-like domain-containing protein [Sinosporangium album]